MYTELATQTRDELNRLAERISKVDTQEGHILAGCVAVAIEEIEKWMYDGKFTPSVMPYREPTKSEPSLASKIFETKQLTLPTIQGEADIPNDWKMLLKNGEKIALIKKVREQYRCGLVEAKELVDDLVNRFPRLYGSGR